MQDTSSDKSNQSCFQSPAPVSLVNTSVPQRSEETSSTIPGLVRVGRRRVRRLRGDVCFRCSRRPASPPSLTPQPFGPPLPLLPPVAPVTADHPPRPPFPLCLRGFAVFILMESGHYYGYRPNQSLGAHTHTHTHELQPASHPVVTSCIRIKYTRVV